MSADTLRALLAAERVTHAPGVWDPLSATLAVRAGHRAVHLSAAAITAGMLGRADTGFVNGTQIADRAALLAGTLDGAALVADADTGFAAPSQAVWSALAYHRAGISGLLLGDPAVATITLLVRDVPQVALVARTTAYATGGLGAAIERCRAYAAAGAGAVLADGVHDRVGLRRLREALPGVPLAVNLPEGADRLPGAVLTGLGVRLVLHPLAALLAAARAASLAYRAIAEEGGADRVERMPWAAFTALSAPASPPGPPAVSGLQT